MWFGRGLLHRYEESIATLSGQSKASCIRGQRIFLNSLTLRASFCKKKWQAVTWLFCLSVSTHFQDDKWTETVFLCSLSPNAHRNCRLLRKISRSNSTLQAAKLSLRAGGENVHGSRRLQTIIFSTVPCKVSRKKFLMQTERLPGFDLLRGLVILHLWQLSKPGITETGNRINNGDFPVSEQQEEEKSTFSKLRCRLYTVVYQAIKRWCPFSCLSSKLPCYLFCLLDDQLPDTPPVVYQTKCWQDYPPSRFASQSQSSIWFMHQPALGKEDHFDRCNVKMDKVKNFNFNLSVFLEALASLDFTRK